MDPWRSHAGRRRVQHTDSHAVAHPPRRRSPLRSHRTASARARAQPGATSDARRTAAAIRNPIGYPTRRDPAPVWYKRSRTDRLRYGANRRDTPTSIGCRERDGAVCTRAPPVLPRCRSRHNGLASIHDCMITRVAATRE